MRTTLVVATLAIGALIGACSSGPTREPCVESVTKTDLEKNICTADADCEYSEFFDACITPESVARRFREDSCRGISPSASLYHREGVVCGCRALGCVELDPGTPAATPMSFGAGVPFSR